MDDSARRLLQMNLERLYGGKAEFIACNGDLRELEKLMPSFRYIFCDLVHKYFNTFGPPKDIDSYTNTDQLVNYYMDSEK